MESLVQHQPIYIQDGMSESARLVKRVADFCLAIVCLLIFSPFILVFYCLIKWEDGGSPIFRQERIGQYGKPFTMVKFRSMCMDAEKNGPQLFQKNNDKRLTKVGAFLRKHHLDEIPQLWNVLKGEMSFVGYRPERQFFIEQILQHDTRYTDLFQIKPGITSYATLYNGYTDTMDKMLRRLELDLFYLKHRSLLFDASIIWDTICSVAFNKDLSKKKSK